MHKSSFKNLQGLQVLSDGSLLLRNDLKSLRDINQILLTGNDFKRFQSKSSHNFLNFSDTITNNIYKKKYLKSK